MSEFEALYRGSVFDIDDPERRGRVRLLVPQVLGESPSGWAEPSLATSNTLQSINDRVWVMFESGDLNRPTFISRQQVQVGDLEPQIGFDIAKALDDAALAVEQSNVNGVNVTQALADAAAAQATADTNGVNVQQALADAAAAMATAQEGYLDQATRTKIDTAHTNANTSLNGVNELNNVTIPNVQGQLDNINTVKIPNIDQSLTDLNTGLSAAENDIITTNTRLNPGGDVAGAINDAAASPITDARLQNSPELTVWPFANNTIPDGTITQNTIADFSLVARKFNTTQHLLY